MPKKKKKSFIGYLRTLENNTPRMLAIFVYRRRNKRDGIVKRVRVTIEELTNAKENA